MWSITTQFPPFNVRRATLLGFSWTSSALSCCYILRCLLCWGNNLKPVIRWEMRQLEGKQSIWMPFTFLVSNQCRPLDASPRFTFAEVSCDLKFCGFKSDDVYLIPFLICISFFNTFDIFSKLYKTMWRVTTVTIISMISLSCFLFNCPVHHCKKCNLELRNFTFSSHLSLSVAMCSARTVLNWINHFVRASLVKCIGLTHVIQKLLMQYYTALMWSAGKIN